MNLGDVHNLATVTLVKPELSLLDYLVGFSLLQLNIKYLLWNLRSFVKCNLLSSAINSSINALGFHSFQFWILVPSVFNFVLNLSYPFVVHCHTQSSIPSCFQMEMNRDWKIFIGLRLFWSVGAILFQYEIHSRSRLSLQISLLISFICSQQLERLDSWCSCDRKWLLCLILSVILSIWRFDYAIFNLVILADGEKCAWRYLWRYLSYTELLLIGSHDSWFQRLNVHKW